MNSGVCPAAAAGSFGRFQGTTIRPSAKGEWMTPNSAHIARGVEAQRHGGHVVAAGAARQSKGHPGVDEIADDDADHRAGNHVFQGKCGGKAEFDGQNPDHQGQDGQIVQHQAEKGVDIARNSPSIARHGEPAGGMTVRSRPPDRHRHGGEFRMADSVCQFSERRQYNYRGFTRIVRRCRRGVAGRATPNCSTCKAPRRPIAVSGAVERPAVFRKVPRRTDRLWRTLGNLGRRMR